MNTTRKSNHGAPQSNFVIVRARHQTAVLVLACALVSTIGTTWAASVSWTQSSSGSWHIASNWSSNPQLPGAVDDVLIDIAGTHNIVHLTGADTVNSITMAGDETLIVRGSSSSGGSLTVNGTSTLNALTLAGQAPLVLNGSSTVNTLLHTAISGGPGILSGTGTVTVTGTADFAVGGIQRGPGTTLLQGASNFPAGILQLAGRVLHNAVTGTFTWTGGIIDLDADISTVAGTFQNDGLFIASGDGADSIRRSQTLGIFNNAGTFRKSGSTATDVTSIELIQAFNNTGLVDVQTGVLDLERTGTHTGGDFSVASGATLSISGGTHTLDTNSNVSGAGTLDMSGFAIVHANGAMTVTNYTQDSFLDSNGVFGAFNANSSAIDFSNVDLSNGTFNVNASNNFPNFNQSGGTFNANEDVTISNFNQSGGTINTAAGKTFSVTSGAFVNNGFLRGNGTFDPDTVLTNNGTLAPGNSVGALTVDGDLFQTAAGIMEFELASLLSFDTLDVLGNLSLDGTLSILSLGGYNPNIGDAFTLITFDDGLADMSDLTGIFADLLFTGFDPSINFDIGYLDHSIVLTAIDATVVPIPPTAWLFGSGLLGLVATARRREAT